jgi:hypothetical protein
MALIFANGNRHYVNRLSAVGKPKQQVVKFGSYEYAGRPFLARGLTKSRLILCRLILIPLPFLIPVDS